MKKRIIYGFGFLLLFFAVNLFNLANAQELLNNGSGTITNNGEIKFLSTSASFTNNNVVGTPIGNASGTINFAGSVQGQVFFGTNPLAVAAYRVDGWVFYSGTGASNIYGPGSGLNSYYTNLRMLNAGVKTYPATETHVAGIYTASGGDRNYLNVCSPSNTFIYDGNGTVGLANQTIFPEDNIPSGDNNRYANLFLAGAGNKTVADASTVYVKYGFASIVGSDLVVDGSIYVGHENATCAPTTVAGNVTVGATNTGVFNMGYEDITYTGSVDIQNSSEFALSQSGDGVFGGTVTVTSGTFTSTDAASGDITINTTGTLAITAGGDIYLGNDNNMYITGAITNAGTGTNLVFADASDVYYNAAGNQSVLPTLITNSYANLHVEGGGTKSASDNVFVRETFGAGTTTNTTTTFTLGDLTNDYLAMGDGAASYYLGSEVVGKMRRDMDIGTAMTTSGTYTMNNAATQIAFCTVPGVTNNFFQLDIRPGIFPSPTYIDAPGAGYYDVQRLIVADGTGDLSLLRIGYLTSEYAGSTPNDIKMLEGWGPGKSPRGDKMVTGTPYGHGTLSIFNTVDLIGVNDEPNNLYCTQMVEGAGAPGNNHQLYDGSAIALTDEQLPLISVRNGRWSDPQTWDEGRTPVTEDYALIRHIVYTGIYDGTNVFGARPWKKDEDLLTGVTGGVLANRVRIDPIDITDDKTGPAVALVIGNNDIGWNDDPDNMSSRQPMLIFGDISSGTNQGLFIDNTAASTWNELTTAGNYSTLNCLWLMTPSTLIPKGQAKQISNSGSIHNNSLLEIGQ
jgi:hypothetical protein